MNDNEKKVVVQTIAPKFQLRELVWFYSTVCVVAEITAVITQERHDISTQYKYCLLKDFRKNSFATLTDKVWIDNELRREREGRSFESCQKDLVDEEDILSLRELRHKMSKELGETFCKFEQMEEYNVKLIKSS